MVGTVAVIVTAHNRADLLDRALHSVRAQTHTDLRIVVVDDASIDATPAICAWHAAEDDRVRVLRLDHNVGVAWARNTGLDALDADPAGRAVTHVAFLDGDDHAEPRWIADLVEAVRATGVPLVAAGHVVDLHAGSGVVTVPSRPVDTLTLVPATPDTTVHAQPFIWAMGYCWNKLYDRAFLSEHQIRFDPDWPLFEDMMFNLDLMRVAPQVAFIESAQYHYVQHRADRLTNRPQVPDLRFRALLARRIVAQLDAWGLGEQTRPVVGSVLGWSIAVECSRTTPADAPAVPALREALTDPEVRWMLDQAVAAGNAVRRPDRPVVRALHAGRVRTARTLALSVLRLATLKAQVGLRLAAR